MSTVLRVFALLLVATAAITTHADELRIPLGSQGRPDAAHLPTRGISMDRVRAGWGEPETVHEAVGQPPITRWDYPAFAVYFEYHHVVHAVVGHRRSEPATLPTDP